MHNSVINKNKISFHKELALGRFAVIFMRRSVDQGSLCVICKGSPSYSCDQVEQI